MSGRPDWDRTARFYALQHRLEAAALAAAADLACVGPTDRVLDVATGTGAWLQALAARGARPQEVTGIDRSAAMLRRCHGLPPGWTVRLGDAGALPAADASIDVVAITYLLHVVGAASRRRVLREVARVLAPGGRVVTVTPTAAPDDAPLPARSLSRLGRSRWGPRLGLQPFDPSDALGAAGLVVTARITVMRGYPSLVIRAELP